MGFLVFSIISSLNLQFPWLSFGHLHKSFALRSDVREKSHTSVEILIVYSTKYLKTKKQKESTRNY